MAKWHRRPGSGHRHPGRDHDGCARLGQRRDRRSAVTRHDRSLVRAGHGERSGELRSRIVGSTTNGRDITGKFVPLKFNKRNGKVVVRGLLQGVIHNENGSKRTFGVMRTMRVKSIEFSPVHTVADARQAAQPAPCDVLNLVLGPLDLDLLGLQISLNRVVLNIVAKSGAGNLLGNLVCAVAGLLDGGLNGLLGRLVNLLNRILSRLGLGL